MGGGGGSKSGERPFFRGKEGEIGGGGDNDDGIARPLLLVNWCTLKTLSLFWGTCT